MKKLSLRWRITFMTMIILVVTCVSMKVMICSSGMMQITELGNVVFDFTDDHKGEVVTAEEISGFESQFAGKLQETKMQFCMYNWFITGTVVLISSIVAFFISRRSLKPLQRFSKQLEKIQMKNLDDTRVEEGEVAELVMLSRSLNDMLERISRAFEAQHQFTSNAAHELRTPLALMQTQMDLYAEEQEEIPEKLSDTMGMIREQTERLSEMVRILLDMSELQTVPCSDRISLTPMIEEVLTDLSSLAREDDITLEQSGEDCEIKGSDILIYRVIFNLVENAIKYNRTGGRVSVATSMCDDKVCVSISDTGYGVPDEFRDHIFQPFFRVDGSGNRTLGGIGLGLSLVWEIIHLHGGTVMISESNENGTVLLLEFPQAV
ncbi:MAG: sensor histidine kinase [Clostridia bacterium]